MTEKEKMINGEYYTSFDEELDRDNKRAKKLCYEINRTDPDDREKKYLLYKELFGEVKGYLTIEPNFFCDYGYNISIGNGFFSNHNLVILDCAKVTIGDNCLIGPNVGIYTACHPINPIDRIDKHLEFAKPITIGNKVWIGGGVQILPGVTIGNNCVIGAGSVVNKDIPDNFVAVGNPCRPVKKISI